MGNVVKIGFILHIVLQIELQTNPILHFGGIMSNIAYVRVSSADQNEARQTEALKVYDIQKWFTEKVSGKDMEGRRQLQDMLDWVREGDTVYVLDFSRLARSTKDLLAITGYSFGKESAPCEPEGKPGHIHAYRKTDVDHDCCYQRVRKAESA